MKHRTFRTTVAATAIAAFSLGWALAPARAQTAPATPPGGATEETVKLESYTVTGSQIKRLEMEKVLPVTVFNKDLIDVRNALTPVELLTALPQVTNVPLSEAASGGANARGDNANVNLRGIGAAGTLVLLNGRRLAPHPITSADAGTNAFYTNVNQLPSQGLDHIDVLRDGASSIYGSDAVAGVINYITKRDYRGTDVRVRFGVPEHGGGQSVQGTLTYGRDFAGGKGRWLTTADYFWRDAIPYGKRDFSRNADHTAQAPAGLNAVGGSFDGRSSVSVFPTFRIGTSTTTNWFRPVGGVLSFTTVSPTAATTPLADRNVFVTNVNQYQNVGQNKSDRQNWFNSVEYDLNSRITAFADISIYHSGAFITRQPVQINAPGSDQFAPMSIDSPYNPYGSRFYSATGAPNADGTPRLTGTPQAITLASVLFKDLGAENVHVHSGVYRVVAGLRGKLGGEWSWEAAGLYTRAYTSDVSNNAARESLFQQAMMRTDKDAFNPFGYTFKVSGGAVVPDQPYANPKSALDLFSQKWRHDGFSAITSGDVRAGGPVFHYFGNTVSLAAGGEYRHEQYLETRPPFAGSNPPGSGLAENDNDYILASYAPNATGNRIVYSGYVETVIPVFGPKHDVPLLQTFEVTGSVRYEDYSDFGTTTRPKVGVNWKPHRNVMIRASFNEGFAAANLPTLYAPTRFTVDSAPGATDIYRNQTVGNATYVMKRYVTGNLALKPVTSIGKSAGIVLEVPKVKGLTLTADYWQIDQSNVIGSYTDNQLFNSDTAKLNAYTQAQLAAGKTIAQVDAGSGTDHYQGDPAVVRTAPTPADVAAFAAYNAGKPASQQAATVGNILSRSIVFQNLAKGYANGIDLSLSYQLPPLSIGRISFTSDWSYLIRSYQLRDTPGAPPSFIERVNTSGASRWRGNGSLAWRKGNWTAGLSGYYIGHYSDGGATMTAATWASLGSPTYVSKTFDSGSYLYRYVVHDIATYNAFVGRRFGAESPRVLRNSSVRVGVINLADRQPPLIPDAAGYSTSVHGSLLQGRTWTLELTRQF